MYRGRSDFSRFFSGEGAFPHQHQSLPDFYVITLWPLLLRSRAESRWKLASDASSPARLTNLHRGDTEEKRRQGKEP